MTNPQVEAYLKQVIERSVHICRGHLRSIVLFGSAASGDFEEGVSDIDLILIVSDDTENSAIAKLESSLQSLEAAYGPLKNRSHFLKVFSSRTALFKPHFIVRESTLASSDLQGLFRETRGFNLPFGRLLLPLAPSSLVVRNVLTGGMVVYGENFLWGPRPISLNRWTLTQSFLVSLVMSLFGALSVFLFEDGTMLSLEAAKWFFLNHSSYVYSRNRGLGEAVTLMQGIAPSQFLHEFSTLRHSYHRSIAFSLACPLFLTYTFLSSTHKRVLPDLLCLKFLLTYPLFQRGPAGRACYGRFSRIIAQKPV